MSVRLGIELRAYPSDPPLVMGMEWEPIDLAASRALLHASANNLSLSSLLNPVFRAPEVSPARLSRSRDDSFSSTLCPPGVAVLAVYVLEAPSGADDDLGTMTVASASLLGAPRSWVVFRFVIACLREVAVYTRGKGGQCESTSGLNNARVLLKVNAFECGWQTRGSCRYSLQAYIYALYTAPRRRSIIDATRPTESFERPQAILRCQLRSDERQGKHRPCVRQQGALKL